MSKKLLSSHHSILFQPSAASSLWDPSVFLSILHMKSVGLCFPVIWETKFHTPPKTDKIMSLCNIILIFLDSKQEDESFWTEL
jgi:hypothetical protein